MSKLLKWFTLQFFADGGASGGDGGGGGEGGTGTGVDTADAGQENRLEALGVPREYAERHRQRTAKRGKATAAPAQTDEAKPANTPAPKSAEAAASNDGGNNAEWDAFFAKPENQSRLQQMMAERGKSATAAKKAADEQMAEFAPALRLLGEKYGIKPDENGSYDLKAVSKAVTDDDSYYEEKALELGVSTDVARKLEQAEELEQRQKEAEARAQRQKQLEEHFNKVRAQAKTLEELVPGFNLDNALQDPEFVRRTAPGMIPADEAYVGMHYKEIMQRQAEEISRLSKIAAAKNVAAGGVRPRENGNAATASVSATPDMRKMSREDRRAYIMSKYPSR